MKKILNIPRNSIIFIILGFSLVILSAIVTVVGITILYKPLPKQTIQPDTVVTLSSKNLIKLYADTQQAEGYSVDSSIGNSVINYQLSDTTYSVQVNSLDNVQFVKKSDSTENNLVDIANATRTFLTENKLTQSSERILTNSTQILFDNQKSVCKYFSSLDSVTKSSTYGLVCIEKTRIVDERNSIKKLVGLAKDSDGSKFKDVVQTVYTEDNKQLSILAINPTEETVAPYMLLFGAIDGTWEYIGKRTTPSVDIKESFELSPQLTTARNNPKYNGFLLKYIQ